MPSSDSGSSALRHEIGLRARHQELPPPRINQAGRADRTRQMRKGTREVSLDTALRPGSRHRDECERLTGDGTDQDGQFTQSSRDPG